MAARKENNFQVSATGGAGTNGQPARFAAPRASNATRNWYRYIRSQVEGAE